MEEDVKILCVDDEKNVLRAITRLFMDEDYQIFTALSGEEGLRILKEESPIQIVISDYRMPGMNGVDFLQKVYKGWPETVRIVLSGYTDTTAIVEAINEGQIYKFIPKPWNDDDLKVIIINAIERYFLFKKNIYLAEELKKMNEELRAMDERLERTVEQRTSDLKLRNKILTVSQNILDQLPVAVIGLDTSGLIVHCNRKGKVLFKEQSMDLMGKERGSALPGKINAFIDKLLHQESLSERIVMDDMSVHVNGVFMKDPDGQEGMVLIFDKESAYA